MAVEDWDIDNIAQATLRAVSSDYSRDEIEDVLDDVLADFVGWSVYSRDTSDTTAVVALVKIKILALLDA
jgi:hypothetical protein